MAVVQPVLLLLLPPPLAAAASRHMALLKLQDQSEQPNPSHSLAFQGMLGAHFSKAMYFIPMF